MLAHPPYRPDLTAFDFWPFPLLKDRLAEAKFSHMQDLSKTVNSELKSTPKNDYQRSVTDWLRRFLLCIQSKENTLKECFSFTNV